VTDSSEVVKEWRRLWEVRLAATTEDERAQAMADLDRAMALHRLGRWDEYLASEETTR
jgi:hypothetical protein